MLILHTPSANGLKKMIKSNKLSKGLCIHSDQCTIFSSLEDLKYSYTFIELVILVYRFEHLFTLNV